MSYQDLSGDTLTSGNAGIPPLAENLGDLARGGKGARHQRAERGQVALILLALRRDELPALIEQDGVAGSGVER